MPYLWEEKGWPLLKWDDGELSALLAEVHRAQGLLLGRMSGLGFTLRRDAAFRTLSGEIIKTSEIEGEFLDVEEVRSSVARRLGIDTYEGKPSGREVDGIVEILIDATTNFDKTLTKKRLFGWHASLFPDGRSGFHKITTGKWRTHGVQVVSGREGRMRVHFVAPPAERVPKEMDDFLSWFNSPSSMDPVIKAAVAHLWFVIIHPFDDGNGRTTRAIAEMALARSEETSQRFYSMSTQIMEERQDYYRQLEETQNSGVDITKWLSWFLGCLKRSIAGSDKMLSAILHKARFWEEYAEVPFNSRQTKILNLLLDGNFKGKLTSSKWAKMGKCSQDTAQRDINALIELKILKKSKEGGRSTGYEMGK
ncbi:MAG: Fic family protein [Thermodesulfobacteriota bacterium]